MTDKELLEFAAKAAGIDVKALAADGGTAIAFIDGCRRMWSPYTNFGDAFKLATDLRLSIEYLHDMSQPYLWLRITDQSGRWTHAGPSDDFNENPGPIVCRAIVEAAAKVGEAMP